MDQAEALTKENLRRVSLVPLGAAVTARISDCITTVVNLNNYPAEETGTPRYFMHLTNNIELGLITHELVVYGLIFSGLYALQRRKPGLAEKAFAVSTLFSTYLVANNIAVMLGYDIFPDTSIWLEELERMVSYMTPHTPIPPYEP
tara:strand:- start:227 stop:664 length:438 start_codon:yes stop_codon:yes gene_type:complete